MFLKFSTYVFLLHFIQVESSPYSKLRGPGKPMRNSCHRNLSDFTHSNYSTFNQRCISHRNCLGNELPYRLISYPENLVESTDQALESPKKWEQFERLPLCWPYLQAALCSIFMPQCDEDPTSGRKSRLSISSVDICHDVVKNPDCKSIERLFGWPPLFNCSDASLYARNCTHELRGYRNVPLSPTCQYPLVPSNDKSSWFKDYTGCSLHCKYPLLDPGSQAILDTMIKVISTVGLFGTSCAVILFWANNVKSKSSKLDQIIIESNMFHCLNYLGWSIQIIAGDIGCSSSGSTWYDLPTSCILSFILTYLPSMYNLVLCAYLGRFCYEILHRGNDKFEIDRRLIYGVPTMTGLGLVSLEGIEGKGLHGICSVAQRSLFMRSTLVMIIIAGTLYGLIYFSTTLKKLIPLKKKSSELHRNYVRIFAIAISNAIYVTFITVNYVMTLIYQDKWQDSIDNYIACKWTPYWKLNEDEISISQKCEIEAKPPILLHLMELLPNLASGMIIASWSYEKNNVVNLLKKLLALLEPGSQSTTDYVFENGETGRQTPSSLQGSTSIYCDNHSRSSAQIQMKSRVLTSRDVINSVRLRETNINTLDSTNLLNPNLLNNGANQLDQSTLDQLTLLMTILESTIADNISRNSRESSDDLPNIYHGIGEN